MYIYMYICVYIYTYSYRYIYSIYSSTIVKHIPGKSSINPTLIPSGQDEPPPAPPTSPVAATASRQLDRGDDMRRPPIFWWNMM